MSFTRGFYCPDHGPIEKAKDKTIQKAKYKVCPDCSKIVTTWERPLNERSGRCGNCAGGAFILAMGKKKLAGQMLRKCKKCGEVINPDHPTIILSEGDKAHEYKQTK